MFTASLKPKGDGSDEEYNSAEDDFPAVGLEELMDDLKLDDGPTDNFSDGSGEDIGGGMVYKGAMQFPEEKKSEK